MDMREIWFSSHLGGSVSFAGVQESGCISGRLPDDPGGFTCMVIFASDQFWSSTSFGRVC